MRLNDYVRRYDSLASEAMLLAVPMRKEFILKGIGRGKRVLDLGCASGQLSRLIKDQNNEVYGVELNPKAADAAEKRGIRVKLFDLNDGIPFEDGHFDAVNAGDILEQIYDTKYFFEECNRVLKPGGTLILSIPNLNSLSNRLKVLTGSYLGQLGAFPDDHFGDHIRVFNAGKIEELCAHTGFQVAELVGIPGLERGASFQLLRPLVRMRPNLGELLLVRAKRLDH